MKNSSKPIKGKYLSPFIKYPLIFLTEFYHEVIEKWLKHKCLKKIFRKIYNSTTIQRLGSGGFKRIS
jgi:hypothetical protein